MSGKKPEILSVKRTDDTGNSVELLPPPPKPSARTMRIKGVGGVGRTVPKGAVLLEEARPVRVNLEGDLPELSATELARQKRSKLPKRQLKEISALSVEAPLPLVEVELEDGTSESEEDIKERQRQRRQHKLSRLREASMNSPLVNLDDTGLTVGDWKLQELERLCSNPTLAAVCEEFENHIELLNESQLHLIQENPHFYKVLGYSRQVSARAVYRDGRVYEFYFYLVPNGLSLFNRQYIGGYRPGAGRRAVLAPEQVRSEVLTYKVPVHLEEEALDFFTSERPEWLDLESWIEMVEQRELKPVCSTKLVEHGLLAIDTRFNWIGSLSIVPPPESEAEARTPRAIRLTRATTKKLEKLPGETTSKKLAKLFLAGLRLMQGKG